MQNQGKAPASPPNVLIIITDQQRGNLHLPLEWQNENLASMTLLRKHGLEFINANCNSCMCSPSRSTLFTGLYPAQHGVTSTLSFGGKFSTTEPVLDNTILNIATALRPVYEPQFRGKWHMSKGGMNDLHSEKSLLACEVAIFGFDGWVAPDAGEDTKLANCGGGYANHDTRYIDEAVAYIHSWKARKAANPATKPFLLVLSLVNPHDVLTYPRTYEAAGYTDPKWLEGPFVPPPGYDENLMANFKPDAQWQLKVTSALALGSVANYDTKCAYLNFYANLIQLIDTKMGVLLEEFYPRAEDGGFGDPNDLAKETLIVRLADHGEMGLAHGSLRQKAFNAYEETLRVPMVFSNPVFVNPTGKPQQTLSLAGLIDVLPTLCGIAQVPIPEGVRGKDLSPIILGSQTEVAVQDEILFTFDDTKAGSNSQESVVNAANRIRSVRTRKWKYTRYFHHLGAFLEEYELYYLYGQGYDQNAFGGEDGPMEQMLREKLADYPLEYVNLAYPENPLMQDWPADLKAYVAGMHAEMRELLHQKEHELLALRNAEVRQRVAGLKSQAELS